MASAAKTDWYERRDELEIGQVFSTQNGASVVKLDRQVPGDGSAWYVADWHGNSWAYYDSRIEPGDLEERLADDYSGAPSPASQVRRAA